MKACFIFFLLALVNCSGIKSIFSCLSKTVDEIWEKPSVDPLRRDILIAEAAIKWRDTYKEFYGAPGKKPRSIFFEVLQSLSLRTKLCEEHQYLKLMTATCVYMEGFVKALLKLPFTRDRIQNFLDKVKIFVAEEKLLIPIGFYETFVIPERTVLAIFEVFKLLPEPPAEVTQYISDLSKYCRSDNAVNLLFDLVEDYMGRSDEYLFSRVLVHPKITNLERFDAFIRSQSAKKESDQFDRKAMVKTILEGPITEYTNSMFMSLISDQRLLLLICSSGDLHNSITRRVIRGGLYDSFIPKLTRKMCGAIKNIAELKKKLESHNADYNFIKLASRDVNEDIDHSDPGVIFNAIMSHLHALNDFQNIDPDFVDESIIKIVNKILIMAQTSLRIGSRDVKFGFTKLALSYLSLLPFRNVPALEGISFDLVLDEVLECDQERIRSFNYDFYFQRLIGLPYAKITEGSVRKFIRLLRIKVGDDFQGYLSSFILVAIGRREHKPDEMIEMFKICHKVYEEEMISFNYVASSVLYKVTRFLQAPFGNTILTYCNEHNLISKTTSILAEKLSVSDN